MRGYGITNRPIRFSLLLLALLLSSCSPVAMTTPLADPDKAKPDERLCGIWKPLNKEANDSDNFFLFIGKVRHPGVPAGIMKTVAIGVDSENYFADISLYFIATSLGGNNYANFFEEAAFNRAKSPDWNKENIKNFLLCKYKIEGDKLMVWLGLDWKAVEAAVRKGELKGTIEKKGNSKKGVFVTLTDGEEVARFLAKGGDKVFFLEESKVVYSRVK